MFKSFLEIFKQVMSISRETQDNKDDIKENQEDLKELSKAVEELAYEVRRMKELAVHESTILAQRVEIMLLTSNQKQLSNVHRSMNEIPDLGQLQTEIAQLRLRVEQLEQVNK